VASNASAAFYCRARIGYQSSVCSYDNAPPTHVGVGCGSQGRFRLPDVVDGGEDWIIRHIGRLLDTNVTQVTCCNQSGVTFLQY
jgi:hypothetical protein